ncbi:MAG TPA: hypothetical protein VJB89_00435 [Candidatus Nanoarchaeia archaeon]|nr:hypothetical protein [Candidatus Nanoarchaeia archaeon]
MEKECNHSEEFNQEEIILENNFCLNGLIDILIDKGIFTKEEYEKKLDQLEEKLMKEEQH